MHIRKGLILFVGASCIGKYLGALDNMYSSLFLDSQWKDTFEKPEILNMSKLGKLWFYSL